MMLSIISVNWNTKDLILKCIDSVLQYSPRFAFEMIVVDNASSDGSAMALSQQSEFSGQVKVIKSETNLGFGKACNLAYANSSGEYVLFLNPDAAVQTGTLENLVNYLSEHADVGIVGPKILNPDGSPQASVRRFPDLWSSLLIFMGLHRIIRPKNYYRDDFDYQKEAEVDQVMGAALLTKRSVIERLGLFDEHFWIWYEEVDFCKRVKAAGHKVVYYPGALITHHIGRSFAQVSMYERKKMLARSLLYYFRKNGSAFEVAIIALFIPVILSLTAVLELLQKLLGFKTSLQT